MNRFEHATVRTVDEALSYLQAGWETRIFAGGTDLLNEMKAGIEKPDRLIDIKGIEEIKKISIDQDSLRIGALSTLDDIENSEVITEEFPLLRQAAFEAASPQLRNMATVAGNICQRPRCWYYRNNEFPCLRKGGETCFAAGGENAYHAVLGGGPCHIVCPSDLAPALLALGASVTIASSKGVRKVPLDDFFVGPKVDPHRENILSPNEIITEIVVARSKVAPHQRFIKIRERQSWDFSLASVAVVLHVNEGKIGQASVVLGGVAPNPWRCAEAEALLKGVQTTAVDVPSVAAAAVVAARPLKGNRYKVDLSVNIVKRALQSILTHQSNI